MAVEQVSSYPLPQIPTYYNFDLTQEFEILKKLGIIEERLSRIEQLLSEGRGPSTE